MRAPNSRSNTVVATVASILINATCRDSETFCSHQLLSTTVKGDFGFFHPPFHKKEKHKLVRHRQRQWTTRKLGRECEASGACIIKDSAIDEKKKPPNSIGVRPDGMKQASPAVSC